MENYKLVSLTVFLCILVNLKENSTNVVERQLLALSIESNKERKWILAWHKYGVKPHKKTLCKGKPEAPKKGAKLPKKPSKEGKLKCWSPEQRVELQRKPTLEDTPAIEHYKMKLSIT